MRILIACLDGNLLWAIDGAISGLYSIDLRTFETRCAIDCRKLFPYGRFDVLSLFPWKEDYLVLVPLEADKSWILYNKVTGEVTSRKVIGRKCREVLIAADSDSNQLYFFPYDTQAPIVIGDLNTLACTRMIENWSGKVPGGCRETAWKGAYNGQYTFFPIRGTKSLVRMDCETGKVDLLKLDLSENLMGVDYAFGELWVLPASGDRLYQIDEDGRTIDLAVLSVGDRTELLPAFARIIVQKRYLFLLPYYRKGIYVYDKQKKTTQVISGESPALEETSKEIHLHYWEYYVRNNRICFLPFRDSYIEIDLDTLAYVKRELFYPDDWSDEEKTRGIIWSHVSKRNSVIRETEECDLKILLKYMHHETGNKAFSQSSHTGTKVWDAMKDEGRTI